MHIFQFMIVLWIIIQFEVMEDFVKQLAYTCLHYDILLWRTLTAAVVLRDTDACVAVWFSFWFTF